MEAELADYRANRTGQRRPTPELWTGGAAVGGPLAELWPAYLVAIEAGKRQKVEKLMGLIQGATIGLGLGHDGYNTGAAMVGNLGSGAAQTTSKILERYTNRMPTITVPEGSRITVRFTADTPVSCEVNQ